MPALLLLSTLVLSQSTSTHNSSHSEHSSHGEGTGESTLLSTDSSAWSQGDVCCTGAVATVIGTYQVDSEGSSTVSVSSESSVSEESMSESSGEGEGESTDSSETAEGVEKRFAFVLDEILAGRATKVSLDKRQAAEASDDEATTGTETSEASEASESTGSGEGESTDSDDESEAMRFLDAYNEGASSAFLEDGLCIRAEGDGVYTLCGSEEQADRLLDDEGNPTPELAALVAEANSQFAGEGLALEDEPGAAHLAHLAGAAAVAAAATAVLGL